MGLMSKLTITDRHKGLTSYWAEIEGWRASQESTLLQVKRITGQADNVMINVPADAFAELYESAMGVNKLFDVNVPEIEKRYIQTKELAAAL